MILYFFTVKANPVSLHAMKAYVNVEVQLQSFLTLALDGCGDQSGSCGVEKSVLLLPGIKPHFTDIQPLAYQLSYPSSCFSVPLLNIVLCFAHFMKSSDYHTAAERKLLCLTEGTELLRAVS